MSITFTPINPFSWDLRFTPSFGIPNCCNEIRLYSAANVNALLYTITFVAGSLPAGVRAVTVRGFRNGMQVSIQMTAAGVELPLDVPLFFDVCNSAAFHESVLNVYSGSVVAGILKGSFPLTDPSSIVQSLFFSTDTIPTNFESASRSLQAACLGRDPLIPIIPAGGGSSGGGGGCGCGCGC